VEEEVEVKVEVEAKVEVDGFSIQPRHGLTQRASPVKIICCQTTK
jgi:hypothetical protein